MTKIITSTISIFSLTFLLIHSIAGADKTWDKFGLGSEFNLEVSYHEIDKKSSYRCLISNVYDDGRKRFNVYDELDEHKYLEQLGSLPVNTVEQAGFYLHEESEDNIDIAKQAYKCKKQVWKKTKTNNSQANKDNEVSITFWINDSTHVPARALQGINYSYSEILLPVNTLRCQILQSNETSAKRLIQSVESFDHPMTLNEKQVTTIKESRITEDRDDRGTWSPNRTIEAILCADVPGHIIAMSFDKKERDYYQKQMKSFVITTVNLRKKFNPAAYKKKLSNKGPTLKEGAWIGNRVGTWQTYIDYRSGQYRESASHTQEQLIALIDDHQIVEKTEWNLRQKEYTEWYIDDNDYGEELVYSIDFSTAFPDNIDKFNKISNDNSELKILDKIMQCDYADYIWERNNHKTEIRIFKPSDETNINLLKDSGVTWVKMEVRNKDDHSNTIRIIELESLNPVVKGAAIRGAVYRSENKSDKKDKTKIIFSADCPHNVLATYSKRGVKEFEWFYITHYGDASSTPSQATGINLNDLEDTFWVPFKDTHAYNAQLGDCYAYQLTVQSGNTVAKNNIIKKVIRKDWFGRSSIRSYTHNKDESCLYDFINPGIVNGPEINDLSLESTEKDTLSIEGTNFDCNKEIWSGTVAGEKWHFTIWVSDKIELPYRETVLGAFKLGANRNSLKEVIKISTNRFNIEINRRITTVPANDDAAYVEEWSTALTGTPEPYKSHGTVWLNPRHPMGIIRQKTVSQRYKMPAEIIEETLLSKVDAPQTWTGSVWESQAPEQFIEFKNDTGYSPRFAPTHRLTKTNINGQTCINNTFTNQQKLPFTESAAHKATAVLKTEEQVEGETSWGDATIACTTTKYADLSNRVQLVITCAKNPSEEIPAMPVKIEGLTFELPKNCVKSTFQVGSGRGAVQYHRVLSPTKQSITIADKEYLCWVDTTQAKIVSATNGQAVDAESFKRWLHLDIPGMIAQSEKTPQKNNNVPDHKPIIVTTRVNKISKN